MPKIAGWEIALLDVVDSTNLEAKRRALAGEKRDLLIIAGAQTAGRGRLDRNWESPKGAGLWMTQLYRDDAAEGAVFLSAAALARALRKATRGEFLIKWPNDIVINGKKACGMLAECGFDGAGAWIALGSGLNIKKGALSGALTNATSVEAETGIVIDIFELLEIYLPEFNALRDIRRREGLAPVLSIVRDMSATIGREVRVNGAPARAVDMAEDGALIIEENGVVRRVMAGDVSVRGMSGYY